MTALGDVDMKKCPRCGKSYTSGEICNFCKNELLLRYNHNIDWKTAYEIELEMAASRKLDIKF